MSERDHRDPLSPEPAFSQLRATLPRPIQGKGKSLPVVVEAMASRSAHQAVLIRALAVRDRRYPVYGDMWRMYGWRGAVFQARACIERAWHTLWNYPQPEEGDATPDVDDLLDAINYCVFTIRSIEERNRDGSWKYD